MSIQSTDNPLIGIKGFLLKEFFYMLPFKFYALKIIKDTRYNSKIQSKN